MMKHVLTIDKVLEDKHHSFDTIIETIKKNIRVKEDGEKEVTYTTDKEGYKITFDEDGNPVETRMDFKEKSNRKKGAVNSALKQKNTKKVVMTHMKHVSEADDEDGDEEDKDEKEPMDFDDVVAQTKKDIGDEGGDEEDAGEEEPEGGEDEMGDEGEEDDMGFDDPESDEGEEDKPKSKTIYNDLESAIDELDAFKLKNAFRMYEQMLKRLYDDTSIKLLNFVYETIPPSRRKKISADIFVKQIEDQIKEKK